MDFRRYILSYSKLTLFLNFVIFYFTVACRYFSTYCKFASLHFFPLNITHDLAVYRYILQFFPASGHSTNVAPMCVTNLTAGTVRFFVLTGASRVTLHVAQNKVRKFGCCLVCVWNNLVSLVF
jgi:hypothetical protein